MSRKQNNLTDAQHSMRAIMLELLRRKRGKPITAPKIVAILRDCQFPQARETDVRKITRWCRSQLPPLLVMSGRSGYYLVEDAENMLGTINHMRKRAISIFRTYRRLERRYLEMLRAREQGEIAIGR